MYFVLGMVHSTLHSDWDLYCLADFKNQKYGYFEFEEVSKLNEKNLVMRDFSPMDFGDYYLCMSYYPSEYFITGFESPASRVTKPYTIVNVPLYRDSVVEEKLIESPLQIMYFDKFKEYMRLDADLVALAVLFDINVIYDELILSSFRTAKNAMYNTFVLGNGLDELKLLLNHWNTFKL